MSFSNELKRYGVTKVLNYIQKNPGENLYKAVELAKKISPNGYESQIKAIENAIVDTDHVFHDFVLDLFDNIDGEVLNKFVYNFLLNASLFNADIQAKAREKYKCNIPWTILLDPTTACNLSCKGCWASEYGNTLNLTFEEIDSIIRQGKELGVYFYIFTGGEPLARKKDLIKICEKHNDCEFLTFTNGTLIDQDFAEEMLKIKNLIPAISIEGNEEATDFRRGEGTYKKVLKAMEILKKNKLPFGISCCYTSENYDSITGEDFVDEMINRGALFAWYFHFMPVGKKTGTELLPDTEQRKKIYNRIREYRSSKPIFFMDFQNDAEYVGGCIAGGRTYLHINANGDIEPCVFIHYSDSNIREKTLLESLQSPLFMAYHKGQPFNENMLRPCPMLENPEILREMVNSTKSKSTDILEKEDVEHLCSKCDKYATNWEKTAEALWSAQNR